MSGCVVFKFVCSRTQSTPRCTHLKAALPDAKNTLSYFYEKNEASSHTMCIALLRRVEARFSVRISRLVLHLHRKARFKFPEPLFVCLAGRKKYTVLFLREKRGCSMHKYATLYSVLVCFLRMDKTEKGLCVSYSCSSFYVKIQSDKSIVFIKKTNASNKYDYMGCSINSCTA